MPLLLWSRDRRRQWRGLILPDDVVDRSIRGRLRNSTGCTDVERNVRRLVQDWVVVLGTSIQRCTRWPGLLGLKFWFAEVVDQLLQEAQISSKLTRRRSLFAWMLQS